jgi:rhamnogalacturonan endolyase
MNNTHRIATFTAWFLLLPGVALAQRQMEHLNRGLVAVAEKDGPVFVCWRLLGTDPSGVGFNVYRFQAGKDPARLNEAPLTDRTCFVDQAPIENPTYSVRPVLGGKESVELSSGTVGVWTNPYLSIPLQTPDGYLPNDASVGDLDGDGEYEIVVHQVGRGRDNSQAGLTTEPILEAYKLDGTRLWRINLGRNIREGAHYTQFMVYDLDGDGKAELACKTADGTEDGQGQFIGDKEADHRSQDPRTLGKILKGAEFLTIFDGATGKALATTDYIPPRGDIRAWGDDYGNRVDRFLACIAYLDGERPSLVMCRGYYTRTVLVAWDFREGKLRHRWTFDSDDGAPGNRQYRGQGNHGIGVADVDGDGRDEIVYGSSVIDDDGQGLYSTGMGHGDAMHITDIDPAQPGLEVFKANGDRASPAGLELRSAHTGRQLFARKSTGRDGVGRACALDVDPNHAGLELWGKGRGVEGLFSSRGELISDRSPRICNMGIWWDGDLFRELLDGVRISKWDHEAHTERPLFDGREWGCASNNGSKSNPCLCADILGDWREELIARTEDGKELRIFVSTIPTSHRFPTLMHDPVYRLSVAWQNVSYNQPAHPGFFLGHGMAAPPKPKIRTVKFEENAVRKLRCSCQDFFGKLSGIGQSALAEICSLVIIAGSTKARWPWNMKRARPSAPTPRLIQKDLLL